MRYLSKNLNNLLAHQLFDNKGVKALVVSTGERNEIPAGHAFNKEDIIAPKICIDNALV